MVRQAIVSIIDNPGNRNNQRCYGDGTRKEAAVEAASAQWRNGASGNNDRSK